MPTDEERRLFGPNLSLLGGASLDVHHVHSHTDEDAAHSSVAGHTSRSAIQGVGSLRDKAFSLGFGRIGGQCPDQESARPPELFHRQVGGTHIFVSHSALAVVKGERVWAVTGAGVEVLS